MSGTRLGGQKAAAKNKARDPDFYRTIGRRGGLAQVPKGFATMDRQRHQAVSLKGGRRKRPQIEKEEA